MPFIYVSSTAGMELKLFNSMKDVYSSQCPLPSTVTGDFELQTQIIERILKSSTESFAEHFATKFFSSDANILKPVPLQQQYKKVTIAMVKKMAESSRYLNLLEYFVLENVKTICKPDSLPDNIVWWKISKFLYSMCDHSLTFGVTKRDCLNKIICFWNTFSVFGYSFEDRFKKDKEEIIGK